jgi:hypothetical protein
MRGGRAGPSPNAVTECPRYEGPYFSRGEGNPSPSRGKWPSGSEVDGGVQCLKKRTPNPTERPKKSPGRLGLW